MSDLGNRISEKRKAEGLSLRDAGKAASVAFSTLGRIEQGATPSYGVGQRIEAWLRGGAPVLPPPPMTLRDYFAIHCDQPGTAEIAAAAGLSMKSPAGVFVILPDGIEMNWADWWNGLSAAERFSLYARVRFAIADAMLAERMKGGVS